MRPLKLAALAAIAAFIFSAGAAPAEVKKYMSLCGTQDGVQRLCAHYRLALALPDGWAVDEAATKANDAQMIVPKGKTYASAPALIYVQVFYHRDKQQSLADFAKNSNDRWLNEAKNAKITPLPDVVRDNGKPGFLRFAFQNPNNPQQAYELGAFGIDGDNDGNEFVLDVVITGSAKAAIDRAEKDYLAFLKAN